MNTLPLILIGAGIVVYYMTFGWTAPAVMSISLIWPVLLIIVGLIIAVKRR